MEQESQIIESDMTRCSITSTKHTIRLTFEKVSKMQVDTKVISSDFYLTLECMCRISFKTSEKWLYLYICNKSATEIKIERTVILFDYNYKKLHEENNAKIFSLVKDKDVDVIGDAKANNIDTLLNDTLIIDLCVTIKEIVKEKENRLICDTDPERKLREDFKTMLENPVNSDVSLQVGDERIPAHWSILCSRSPYFKRMFESGMQERVQNSVTITDSSLGTVKKLIQFLYTADFVEKDDFQELFDLYYAADKYEVMDLRTLCGHKIMSNAITDNAGEILQLSHRHNDKAMKMEVMDFIHSHSDAVFQTESWKKFEASEPAIAELIIFFCLKKN